MKRKLEELLEEKEALKHRIRIAEIGNDSYYLSPLYAKHQSQMHALNKEIEALTETSDFSTDESL